VACALGLFATAALAGQSSAHRTARADLEGIIADYGLLVIAKAPPGVNPVTVASAAELQGLLDSIGGGTAREGFLASSTQDAKGFALTSGGTLLRRYHWRSGGGPYWYNLDANVYIGSYGSFTWIDRISSVNFYLSGLVAQRSVGIQ
jgi:hypothetical protein